MLDVYELVVSSFQKGRSIGDFVLIKYTEFYTEPENGGKYITGSLIINTYSAQLSGALRLKTNTNSIITETGSSSYPGCTNETGLFEYHLETGML